MRRATRDLRVLGRADRDEALALCARDPVENVYVGARLLENDLDRARGSALGFGEPGALESVVWAAANIVPVNCSPEALEAVAARVRRRQGAYSSIFGPTDQVTALWSLLRRSWNRPLDVRLRQPLMAVPADAPLGVAPDPRVRTARRDELDVIAPAAAAMFTEEIGYAPYSDEASRRTYWHMSHLLIARGRSYVIRQGDEVLFKAEVGSVALGVCQIQGVWVHPDHRGRGLSAPAMAAVVEHARTHIAPVVTLYVNDYNLAALACYRRVGFVEVGLFSTILV